jgi:hypothetical protein
MDPDLPERLLPTRDLLGRSLMLHPREQAPAMPAGLAADLALRFAPGAIEKPSPPGIPLMEKVRTWLSTPGFGLAAAAVVVVGIAIPMISTPDREIFRGAAQQAGTDMVRIAFIGEEAKIETAIKSSGNFEAFAFAVGAESLPGPKVVIDFRAGVISAVDRDGQTVHSKPIPADAKDAPDAVADAISRL